MPMKQIRGLWWIPATNLEIFAGAVTVGSLLGIAVRGSDVMTWVFTLLLLCAGVTAIVQQTLP